MIKGCNIEIKAWGNTNLTEKEITEIQNIIQDKLKKVYDDNLLVKVKTLIC